ncbi:MAG: NFACT family protein [Thermomicrobiales bacterium]
MFDLMTTAAIVDEFSTHIVGGRVQTTGLRDRDSVVLEIYAHQSRTKLLATIGGHDPACYLTKSDVRSDPEIVTPFALLMRKHLRGAMVIAVSQPPLDRVVQIHFAKLVRRDSDEIELEEDGEADMPGEVVHSTLSIELMGRRSNVILVSNDGVVLESLKRVTPLMSGVRPVLPQRPYSLPPMGDRIDPRNMTVKQLQDASSRRREMEDLNSWFVRSVAGISPQMARELFFRAAGQSHLPPEALSETTLSLLANETRAMLHSIAAGIWEPTLFLDDDGAIDAYAAQPLRHLVAERALTVETKDSISSVIEAYQGTAKSLARHAGRRDRLHRTIEASRTRARARRQALQQELLVADDGDRYRRWGEAILANLWTLEPGQDRLTCEGEDIPLDPGEAPSAVAQEYFARYRKAGRGREQLEPLLAQASTELDYLDQLFTLVELAETFDEIEALRREWEARQTSTAEPSAPGKSRRSAKQPPRPMPLIDIEGHAIYVGRSGQANDTITFDVAGPHDYWFHVRGAPGAHVILKPAGLDHDPSDPALEAAASLAAYYSGSRESTAVEVDICRRKDVRKIKGAGPGMVSYRNERTIRVSPRSPEDVASQGTTRQR